MRRVAAFLVLICMLTTLISVGFAASNQYYLLRADFEDGSLPAFQINSGFGKVENIAIGGNRAMFLNHEHNGGTVEAKMEFNDINDGVLKSELSVLQPDKKSNGEILFSMSGNGNKIVSVETENDNISLRMPDGSFTPLVENYFHNKWYDLNLEIDILNKKIIFYVDNVLTVTNADFLSDAVVCNEIKFVSSSAPGFMVDNLKIYDDVEIATLNVTGDRTQAIPPVSDIEYEYSASLTSSSGQPIADTFEWSLGGEYSGVKLLSEEGNTNVIRLIISPSAVVGTNVILNVRSGSNPDITEQVAIGLVEAQPKRIVISGDRHLSVVSGKSDKFSYDARVFDSFDNELKDMELNWSLQYHGNANLSFNSEKKEITLSGSMPESDEFAVLTASIPGDSTVFTNFNILVQPYDVYYNDLQRIKVAKESIDSVLKAATSKDGNNPLFANWINPYADSYVYTHFSPHGKIAYTDMTSTFTMLRAMVGLSGLTGDESYSDRVIDMYQHYLDYGKTPNGLYYWGNHAFMDIETGMPFEAYATEAGGGVYHEVEERNLYFEPWLEIDPDSAMEYCKAYWLAIVNNWSNYCYNRHAISNKVLDETNWTKDTFSPPSPDFPYVQSMDLPFMSSACVLLNLAMTRYKYMGDMDALRHAKNLAYNYFNTTNEKTKMYGYIFTTSEGMAGTQSILDTYGDKWWTWVPYSSVSGNNWGDRIKNQFQPLFTEGYVTTDAKGVPLTAKDIELVLEPNWVVDPSPFEIELINLGTTIGADTELGSDIIKRVVQCRAADIDYFYDFQENTFPSMRFSFGAHVGGQKAIRPGYHGSVGTYMGYSKPGGETIYCLIYIYDHANNRSDLENELSIIWSGVRNMLDKKYGIGDIGNPYVGEEAELNVGTTSTDPWLIRIMLQLYNSTGNREYLDLARVVGNNIINTLYSHGYIIKDSTKRFLQTDGEYQWVLLKLEEALINETGLVPDSDYYNGEETGMDSYDENMRYMPWNFPPQYFAVYDNVEVNSVTVKEKEIVVKVGESVPLTVEVYPNDAASKNIFWETEDISVASVSDNNVVTGKKTGETTIYAVASGGLGITSEPIKIIVE